jgi:hypothetical protein
MNKMSSGKDLAVCTCQRIIKCSMQFIMNIVSWLINSAEQNSAVFLLVLEPLVFVIIYGVAFC